MIQNEISFREARDLVARGRVKLGLPKGGTQWTEALKTECLEELKNHTRGSPLGMNDVAETEVVVNAPGADSALQTEESKQKLKKSVRRLDCRSVVSEAINNDDFSFVIEPPFEDKSLQDAKIGKREASSFQCGLTLVNAATAAVVATKWPKKSDDTHATDASSVLQAGIPSIIYIFANHDDISLEKSLSSQKNRSSRSVFSLFSHRSAASPRRKSHHARFNKDDEEAHERNLLEL